jgi:hypothetical protein
MASADRKKRSNKQAVAVAEILGGVLEARPLKMRLMHEDVFRQWQKIVGKGLVDKCQPRRIKGHTLYLDVVSSSWAHQLIYLQEEIISRVNKLAGTLLIASIHCRAVKKSELKKVDSDTGPTVQVLRADLVSEAETRKWQSEIAAEVKDPDLCRLLSRMRCHSEIKRRALRDLK